MIHRAPGRFLGRVLRQSHHARREVPVDGLASSRRGFLGFPWSFLYPARWSCAAGSPTDAADGVEQQGGPGAASAPPRCAPAVGVGLPSVLAPGPLGRRELGAVVRVRVAVTPVIGVHGGEERPTSVGQERRTATTGAGAQRPRLLTSCSQFSPQPVRKMFTSYPPWPTLPTRIPAGQSP